MSASTPTRTASNSSSINVEVSNKDPAMAFLDMIGGVSLNEPGTPLEFGSGSFGGGGDGSGLDLEDYSDSDSESASEAVSDAASVDTTATSSSSPHSAPSSTVEATQPKKSAITNLIERLDRRGSLRRLTQVLAVPSPDGEAPTSAKSDSGIRITTRPPSLPPKTDDEEKKHIKMHEQLVREAQKREERKIAERRQRRVIREKHMAEWTAIWVNEIIPKWAAKSQEHRTRQLWKQGLPPKVRGTVWMLGVGNTLNVTDELFNICLKRAKMAFLQQSSSNSSLGSSGAPTPSTSPPPVNLAGAGEVGREDTVALIGVDLNRTFPSLGIFQSGGPLYEPLREVLMAYACYRPDIGYMQGMSFLAAMLLLNMDSKDAFRTLCNLLNRRCHMSFFQLDQDKINGYKDILNKLIHEHLPVSSELFTRLGITVDIFMYDWVLTLFSKSLPLEISSRIWDRYILQGDRYLFRVCVGILHLLQKRRVEGDDSFESVAYDLTHLPQEVEIEEFFYHIDCINISKTRFVALHQQSFPDVAL